MIGVCLHQPPPRPKPARLAHLACHAARTTWARRALAPHFRLLELGSGNRPVESGAQLLGCLQRQLNPSPRPGFESRVDEVERDDIAQRRMARMATGLMQCSVIRSLRWRGSAEPSFFIGGPKTQFC